MRRNDSRERLETRVIYDGSRAPRSISNPRSLYANGRSREEG